MDAVWGRMLRRTGMLKIHPAKPARLIPMVTKTAVLTKDRRNQIVLGLD